MYQNNSKWILVLIVINNFKGLTCQQKRRLDQNCRNLMMGRRFAFANPTSATISVQISAYSDNENIKVQVTDNSGSESKFIVGNSEKTIEVQFSKSDLAHKGSDIGIGIEAEADIGVTVQIQRNDGSFDQSPPPERIVTLLCISDEVSQHFLITKYQSQLQEVPYTIVSLSDDNTVAIQQDNQGNVQKEYLKNLDVYRASIQSSSRVSCSGLCAVYSISKSNSVEVISPVPPIQFYPSSYYLEYTSGTNVCIQGIQFGASANIMKKSSGSSEQEIETLQPVDNVLSRCLSFGNDTGNATITCSSACVPFLETPGDPPYRYIDMFSSSFQSDELPFVRTNQSWILAFDYGVDLNRMFSEVISIKRILLGVADRQVSAGETTFVNEGTRMFKFVFLDTTVGVHRITGPSGTDPSPIYIRNLPQSGVFLLPFYTANESFPSQLIDLCNTPLRLCNETTMCQNLPETFTYDCVAVSTITTTTVAAVCTPGTKQNTSDGSCIECDFDEYQPDSGQMECIPCPPANPVTMQRGSTTQDQCGRGVSVDLESRARFFLDKVESIVHGEGVLHLEVVTELILDSNGIREILSYIFRNFKNLKSLAMQSNQISTIQANAFEGLGKLQTLQLNSNQIETLDSATFVGLQSLIDLRLSSNSIQMIGRATWFQTPELQTLDLSYNNLSSIGTDSFLELHKCRTLWMRQSNVKSIDAGTFQEATNLKTLDLSMNSLQTIENGTFDGLNVLTSLTLRDCSLNENTLDGHWSRGLHSLESLFFDNNQFGQLFPDLFVNLTKLTGLYFYQNQIHSIDPFTFSGMHKLRFLDVCQNNISELRTNAFAGLTSLEELRLSGNQLTNENLEDGWENGLENVEILRVRKNRFSEVSTGMFSSLTKLRMISIDGNQITSVQDNAFEGLLDLEEMELHNNPIETMLNSSFDPAYNFTVDKPLTLTLFCTMLRCSTDLCWLLTNYRNGKISLDTREDAPYECYFANDLLDPDTSTNKPPSYPYYDDYYLTENYHPRCFDETQGWSYLISPNSTVCSGTILPSCESNPCQNGASCFENGTGHYCDCTFTGFTGNSCEINIDECASDPCQNRATCNDGVNEFNCSCIPRFMGPMCEFDVNECEDGSHECSPNATCTNEMGSYRCDCIYGFSGNGSSCQDIDECASDPYPNRATCNDAVNEFNCSCVSGFMGPLCEFDVNECNDGNHDCSPNATCTNEIGSYTCDCKDGFTGNGFFCQDVNECNNGNHDCSPNATCTNEIGSYRCDCKDGFIGDGYSCIACQDTKSDCGNFVDRCSETAVSSACPMTCNVCPLDLEECESDLCMNGGTCFQDSSMPNFRKCTCATGYTGLDCETDLNQCEINSCLNGGSCTQDETYRRCICRAGYTGINCETDIDYCDENQCLNGGTCRDGINSFTCDCIEGFTNGERGICEINIDDCETGPCLNGGTCVDGDNSFTCNCAEGYSNGELGICEIDNNFISGFIKWREGFGECSQLPKESHITNEPQQCATFCRTAEVPCQAFVIKPENSSCILTRAICESDSPTGKVHVYYRNNVEFERLSSFNLDVFMEKSDASKTKHYFFGLLITNLGNNPQFTETLSYINLQRDKFQELLFRSEFVVDFKLDRVIQGSVVAVYDALVNDVTKGDFIGYVSGIVDEFKNVSGLNITDVFPYDPEDQCAMITDLCLNGGNCKWNALGGIPTCECPDDFEGDRCQNPIVRITSIFPNRDTGPFGPESGGTNITLTGSHLDLTGLPMVILGGVDCPVLSEESSPVKILCKTKKLIVKEIIEQKLPISVRWPADGHPLPQGLLETDYNFVYLEDPDIQSVYPLETIVSGGIDLTVTGENMDSVAVPVMEMLVYAESTLIATFYEMCDLVSDATFICPTANLNLTENIATRKKRQIGSSTYRYRYNGKEVEIEINFHLDDVQEFRNMSEARPQYSRLEVYVNPEFTSFEEVETFRPYWPFNDEFVTMTGDHLLQGLRASDYKVSVGVESCTDISVSSNGISCRAPSDEPDKANPLADHPELKVQVGRGGFVFDVGHIKYEDHLFEYLPAQIGFGVIIFVIILVALIIFLCRRYLKMKRYKSMERYSPDGEDPDISPPTLMAGEKPIDAGYLNKNEKPIDAGYLNKNEKPTDEDYQYPEEPQKSHKQKAPGPPVRDSGIGSLKEYDIVGEKRQTKGYIEPGELESIPEPRVSDPTPPGYVDLIDEEMEAEPKIPHIRDTSEYQRGESTPTFMNTKTPTNPKLTRQNFSNASYYIPNTDGMKNENLYSKLQ